MRKAWFIVAAASLALLSGCSAGMPGDSGAYETEYANENGGGYGADGKAVFPEDGADIEPVEFSRKVDGDTAWFTTKGGEEIKVRFLAVDTPETVKAGTEVQEWGPEASEYTAGRLEGASEILLEWDPGSDVTDAYGRYLAWVWVDGCLLEEELVSRGFADVAYIYGDYRYTDVLYEARDRAMAEKAGIWSD